jgi:phenylacetate-coenzyme A ligase PaaK-like adenylate-forming protein
MSSLAEKAHSEIAMRLQCLLLGRGSQRVLKVYQKKTQILKRSPEDIRGLQREKLKALLQHAAEHVPFYRERLRLAGFRNAGDLTADLLPYFPVLTREDLQLSNEDLQAQNWRAQRVVENSSGGSTGAPVSVWQDQAYRDELLATSWISDSMQGWRFGDRVAMLWGSPKDRGRFQSLKSRVLMRARGVKFYDAFAMGRLAMEQYHRELQGYRPHVLIGYASALALYAHYLIELGRKPAYPLVSVISSAESLTADQRRLIQSCFQVPVFDRYGSREVGCIGSECLHHSGFHLHPLEHVVEVVDALTGEPVFGSPGKVLVTSLTNFVMPLIRYEIGDLAVMGREECPCGFPGPLLKTVVGRISDFIQSTNGRQVHGEYFTHAFYGVKSVRQFQLVQKSRTDFVLRIVKTPEFRSADLDSILAETGKALGGDAKLSIEFPSAIAPSSSGKQRFTISELESSLQ